VVHTRVTNPGRRAKPFPDPNVPLRMTPDEVVDALRAAALDAGRDLWVERPREAWAASDRPAAVAALRVLGAHARHHGLPGAPLLHAVMTLEATGARIDPN